MPTLGEIASELGGELHGSAALELTGLGPYDDALEGQLVVAYDQKALAVAEQGAAAAAVLPRELSSKLPHISVADPRQALVQLLYLFAPPVPPASGVHPEAEVHVSAKLGAEISVGAYAVIGEGVVTGERCRIGPHCVLGAGTRLGDDVLLHADVTLYDGVRVGDRVVIHSGAVIGGNGFGFHPGEGGFKRIPQLGSVALEDDVEIGCNVCVDRATLGLTRVGRGTKIDNLVQVAHNCRLGENVFLAGQAGIAGSSTVGDRAVLGGQAGVADHVHIGADAKLGAQCGVNRNVEAGAQLTGTLGMPVREFMQVQLLQPRLRELFRRVDKLEQTAGGEIAAD